MKRSRTSKPLLKCSGAGSTSASSPSVPSPDTTAGPASTPAHAGQAAASSRTSSAHDLGSVFVVDDDEMVGLVVQDVLELHGYKPTLFLNPVAALEAFEAAQPKPVLLVADFVMMPLDGMQLIMACRRHAPHLKTLLYSGLSEAEIFGKYAVRPNRFLTKPFLPRVLLQVVETILKE